MKVTINTILLLSICMIVISCAKAKNYHDPKQLGKDFCECMKKNGGDKEYLYSLAVCDGELIQKYPLYKYFRVEERYNIYPNGQWTDIAEDSVGRFMITFEDYIKKNCCNVAARCNDSTKIKK